MTELCFRPTDFERYREDLQRDPTHNAERLEVRRKLEGFGKKLCKSLAEKEVAFTSRASLHHPFRFNAFKVNSQFVYLSRADKERKKLKSILGVELGKDLDQNYVHTLLNLEIHEFGLEVALRIHQKAWWDGENFKRQTATPEGRARMVAALRQAPKFSLRIADHRKLHPHATMTEEELVETLKYYTPGESWLHVELSIPKDSDRVSAPDLEAQLTACYQSLMPLYKAIRWTEKNNFLFG